IVAVAVFVLSWLETARPASTVCGSVTEIVLIDVRPVPSDEYQAVMLSPLRSSLIHCGAAPATAKFIDVPPAVLRHWSAMPLPGVTNTAACGDDGSAVARIMMPAFVHA